MDIFWVRFSDPKFFFRSTISGLWTTKDSFLGPIFGPQIFLWDYQFLDCGRRCIFFWSPICRSQRTFWWLLSLAFLCLISADLTTTLSPTLGPKLTGALASNFLTIVVGITYFVIRMCNIYFSKLTYRQILCITDLITLYRQLSESLGSSQLK